MTDFSVKGRGLKYYALSLTIAFCLLGNAQQKRNMSPPPEPMNQEPKDSSPDPALQHRLDLAQLQQEADDLARTAQTIPSDVASVRKGMLPKDVIEKLKQIEKLSKHLRAELKP